MIDNVVRLSTRARPRIVPDDVDADGIVWVDPVEVGLELADAAIEAAVPRLLAAGLSLGRERALSYLVMEALEKYVAVAGVDDAAGLVACVLGSAPPDDAA